VLNINEIDFFVFISILILTITINFYLFKKLLFGFMDPMFFVIINTSLTLTLIIYDRYFNKDYENMLYVIFCQYAFIVGARITLHVINLKNRPFISPKVSKDKINSRSALWVLNISSSILLFVLAYYMVIGLPAFSSDPELARVLTRKDGGGGISRIFDVFSYLSLTMWFYIRGKKIKINFLSNYISIILPILLLFAAGSKASIIYVYLSLFSVSKYISFEMNENFKISIKYVIITIILILSVSFIFLFVRAETVDPMANPIDFASHALLYRVIFSGVGAFYYFSNNIIELNNLNILDYIYQYLIIPIFAPLRLVSYEQTVGSILAISMVGDDTFGPNPSMYVEGKVYFGWIGGIFYCAVLGVIFSIFRYLPLKFNHLPSYVRAIGFSFGSLLVLTITFDMILFTGAAFSAILLLSIILFIVFIINKLTGYIIYSKLKDQK
jgi:hypothetical protein